MGGRAEHNKRRQLKLFQKHTGKEFNSRVHDITGRWDGGSAWPSGRSGGNWWETGRSSGNWWETEAQGRYWKAPEWDSWQTSTQRPDTREKKSSLSRQKKAAVEPAAPARAGRVLRKAKDVLPKKTTKKTTKKKRKVSSKEADDAEGPRPRLKKRKKVKAIPEEAGEVEAQSGNQKAKKVKKVKKKKKSGTTDKESAAMSKRKLKAIRKRCKGYIICPGSVSDRFGKQPKNDNERQLLWSGQLSWEWLRNSDNPSGSEVCEADDMAHRKALYFHEKQLHWKAAARLQQLDELLGTHARFPPCARRAALAAGLQRKGALRKRCTQHVEKVVAPVLLELTATRGSAELVAAARDRLRRCAEQRRTVNLRTKKQRSQSIDGRTARAVWLRELVQATSTSGAASEDGWVTALKIAFYSRFCPMMDAATFKEQCFRIVNALAQSSRARKPPGTAAPELCILPLGVFTSAEVLMLLVAACSMGEPATVIRKRASGPADAIFRTSEVQAERSAAEAATELSFSRAV